MPSQVATANLTLKLHNALAPQPGSWMPVVLPSVLSKYAVVQKLD